MVLSCHVHLNQRSYKSCAFIDSGGNGFGFIDINFVQKLSLKLLPLRQPRILRVVDGRKSASGLVNHYVKVELQINQHSEIADLFVTRLGQYPIILGHGWLARHNPSINWSQNCIRFDSCYCAKKCLAENSATNIVQVNGLDAGNLQPSKIPCPVPDVSITSKFNINAIDQILKEVESKELQAKLPDWLHHQIPAFSKLESRELPPHRSTDHKIVLREGTQPPFGRLYGMTREELVTLREWLQDNLSRGFIRASSSPAASPVLFVKKADGGLRLCMDYRGINAITVKNRYPIPLVSETLDRLSKARYFTKLDVISAFNRIRVAKGDEWKTAFRTRYGLFESLVMPFGLTNAPSTFQNYINSALQEHLDVFCTAYLDDVLVYSNSREEHRQHVNLILDKLQTAGHQLDIKKCNF